LRAQKPESPAVGFSTVAKTLGFRSVSIYRTTKLKCSQCFPPNEKKGGRLVSTQPKHRSGVVSERSQRNVQALKNQEKAVAALERMKKKAEAKQTEGKK
jgi:hypothetical protein